MRKYPSIDFAKLLLSLLVVALHVNPFGENLGWLRFPITRIAVPLFFMISSFLFFEKLLNVENEFDKQKAVIHFCRRNLQLYAAWFVVLMPITCKIRGYFQKSILELLKTVTVQFIFSSTFSVSWYIMALVIGMLIVYYLCKYTSGRVAFVLGMAAYVLCCLATNYRELISDLRITGMIIRLYPADIYLSFPASIIWIYLGKIIAENKQWIERKILGKKRATGIIFFGILFLEHYVIQRYAIGAENDCYFSLLLVCPWLLSVIIGMDCPKLVNTKSMRETSTIIYCSHRAFEWIYEALFRLFQINTRSLSCSVGLFFLVMTSCFLLSAFINKVKTNRYCSWLRYLQ